MKISSASKKVLASALSAAMVVAFAPTVAFGAQAGNKVKVQYDLGTGTDTAAGFQGATSTQEYTVANGDYVAAHVVENATGEYIAVGTVLEPTGAAYTVSASATDSDNVTVNGVQYTKISSFASDTTWSNVGAVQWVANNDGTKLYNYVEATGEPGATVTLANGSNLKLKSGAAQYSFKSWKVTFDADGDGAYDHASKGDINASMDGGSSLNVSNANIHDGATISAKAVYDTATIADNALVLSNNGDADHKYATLTFAKSSVTGVDKAINGWSVEVAGPGSTATLSSASTDSSVTIPAAVGEYTVTLKDGNGTVLDTQKTMVGSVVLTGAYYKNIYTAGQTFVGAQTIYYKATEAKQVIADILSGSGVDAQYLAPYKKVTDTTTGDLVGTAGKVAAGAVSTEVSATFAGDKASILGMDYSAGEVTIAYNNQIIKNSTDTGWITKGQNFNAPATSDETGYYLVVKDADGKIVKETAQTGASAKAFASLGYTGSLTFAATGSKSYTATLYKVTKAVAGVTGGADGVAGTVEDLGSKTVEVKAVAAPTWTYAANEKVADGGTLTLANAAGDGFDVKYQINGTTMTYDTSKGGIAKVTAGTVKIWAEATAANSKADPKKSEEVTLTRYTTAKTAFDNWATVNVGYKAVNGAATTYYGNVAGVKAAVEAADQGFVTAGYKAQASGSTEWNADVTAAKKSVIEAVAAVAKDEAAKMYAGVEGKDGSVSKISEDNYNTAVKAIEKVVSDFAANHDSDATNNVVKNGEFTYGDNDGSYVNAIDEALKTASKAQVKYAKADVDAAATVTKALKEAKTSADAEAAVKAYNKLTAAQKELVSAADVAAAQDVVAKAEVKDAQDEAALAKVKGKTVKAKAKKKTTAKLTVVASKSGAKSTFKKTSGNAKITVAKGGKITVKKGLKAGKKYTAKVKATVGAATKTVTVTVKVSK